MYLLFFLFSLKANTFGFNSSYCLAAFRVGSFKTSHDELVSVIVSKY